MKIPKPICLVIIVMLVGKARGYREELIIGLVKHIVGFEMLVNAKVIIKKAKDFKEFAIEFFTKN